MGGGAAAAPGAPAPGQAQQGRGGGGGGRGNAGPAIFTAVDANKDGAVTRDEMKSTFDTWFTQWDSAKAGSLTQEQLQAGLTAALPAPAPPAGGGGFFPGQGPAAQPQTPNPEHVQAMMAALPATAPAKPKQPRKVLVLGKAGGFVHSSIPLAGRTIEEIGKKTGAWTTTITYDSGRHQRGEPQAVRRDLPGQHDRRVPRRSERRGGDGGAHARRCSTSCAAARASRASTRRPIRIIRTGPRRRAGRRRTRGWAGRRAGGRGGGRGGAGAPVAAQFVAQGDKNADQKISREEFAALADAWYTKLDTGNTGRVSQADFPQRFAALMPAAARRPRSAARVPGPGARDHSSGPTTRSAPGPSSTR